MRTFDRNKTLNTLPHYTDERYRHAQVVFGREEDGLEWNYADRLSQWDYEKWQQAVKIASATVTGTRTAKFYEAILSAYWDKPVELVCVMAGWNVGNGYPYQVFGYRFKTEEVQS